MQLEEMSSPWGGGGSSVGLVTGCCVNNAWTTQDRRRVDALKESFKWQHRLIVLLMIDE
jgi:hypothetical protein